jgi:PAS domain S-box-containing protein
VGQAEARNDGDARKMDTAELAEAVLRSGSDGIVGADRQSNIRFWNPGAERIFGYSADEAVGQSLDIIIPERLRARHWQGYRHVMATGESRYDHGDVLAVPGKRKNRSDISLEFTIVPLRGEKTGQLMGLAAILRDVTDRFQEIRDLKQKLAAVNKLQMGDN